MEAQKPKTVHSGRDFLKEVGIIVLGVLIALGAQQLVSEARDSQLAQETRATARAELKASLDAFVNRRATQACINRRLDEVSTLLQASAKPGYKPPTWIGRPQRWGFSSAGWDAAAQGGRVALLSQKEQAAFGEIYARLHDFNALQLEEQRAWADIRQLEDQPQVDLQMRARVRSALQEARLANWNVRVDLEQTLAGVGALGVAIRTDRLSSSPSICLPLSTPRDAAVAKVNAYFKDQLGEP